MFSGRQEPVASQDEKANERGRQQNKLYFLKATAVERERQKNIARLTRAMHPCTGQRPREVRVASPVRSSRLLRTDAAHMDESIDRNRIDVAFCEAAAAVIGCALSPFETLLLPFREQLIWHYGVREQTPRDLSQITHARRLCR